MLATKKKKLTIRVDARLIEQTKAYAAAHNTSVSQLVESFLLELNQQKQAESSTPILDALTGILPAEANIEDYHDYLMEKYAGDE